jgi:hypothetical protein
MNNISMIRETFGVMAAPLDGMMMGMEWVRPLQDFDATTIREGPFNFVLTRDVSRHMALDQRSSAIHIFCEESIAAEDSLRRLEGNIIARYLASTVSNNNRILNLDVLAHEHTLLHTLLFSSDESRQIAFSLGLVPPRLANLFLRLSAFPNYAGHLITLRKELQEWRPRRFRDLFIKGSHTYSVSIVYAGIAIILILVLLLGLAITGTIGVWFILRHVS